MQHDEHVIKTIFEFDLIVNYGAFSCHHVEVRLWHPRMLSSL